MTHDEYIISGALRRVVVVKHHGPGPHPGTGTDQSVHGGDGASVAEDTRLTRDIWIGVRADAIPVGTRDVDIPREMRHTPSGAPIRGRAMSPDDPRIGERVYHMTTALDAVSQAGELSARGVGGLGGDKTDQIVSMTVSRQVGDQLVRDMRMMAEVSREFAATEPIYDWNRETHVHQRLDRATGQPMDTMTWLRPLLSRFGEYAPQYGFSFSVADVAAYYGMQEEQVGTMDYTLREWGNQFFQMRSRYTGVRNPLFFSDGETLARIDPSQVGLVSIPRENLRTGALLTDFDLGTNFLEEVRLYGDVPLNGAQFIRDIPAATPTTVTRGGPGSGFKRHKGRPGKVGGSLPSTAWAQHGFSVEEFTKKPDLPKEQVPELGKDISIVYSGRGNKARWLAVVRDALDRFRNATGIAPQGITITDHLPWVFWRSTPYEVLANMPGADAKEIANVLVRGPFAAARGVYVGGNERTIYIQPELGESLPPNLSWTRDLGLQDFRETMAHELGHWLTMTAAPETYQMVAPNARYREAAGRSYPLASFGAEYAADLVASLTRPEGRTWPWRLDHAELTGAETAERQDLMERIRHNLVLRTAKEQPGLMVLVLMGDEIVAVPEAELDDLPKGAIINPLYLWWKEHFQPKVELDLDAKAFGWQAEDIAVQGEPEDGIFAVVEDLQRPKGRKETMAEAAGQEAAPVPSEEEAPAEAETPGEDAVKSAFETIMKAIFRARR